MVTKGVWHGEVARSVLQVGRNSESKPVIKGSRPRVIGEAYCMEYQQEQRLQLAEFNADHWKSWGTPGWKRRLDTPAR